LDVLQHEAHVDRSGPKINQHPTAEPLTPDEFRDDYMSVLNDEEMSPNVSLDDMKFQHEEENFPIKDTPLEHQPVDELIDARKDTTNLLPENVKPDEFRDDYMFVLNDEEMSPNVSLDDIKFQHEEENFPIKDTPLEHQPVDELIDARKDTTNLLPENVKYARIHIDDILLPSVGSVTRWVHAVPIKINVFAWKVCLDKLPTRFNLSLRGLDIPSILSSSVAQL
nr:RNA-directed DNA polymerase, eukaryota [Tanacetum cinerariifolium]